MAEIGGADEHVVVNQSPRSSFQTSSLSYDCEYPLYNSSLNFKRDRLSTFARIRSIHHRLDLSRAFKKSSPGGRSKLYELREAIDVSYYHRRRTVYHRKFYARIQDDDLRLLSPFDRSIDVRLKFSADFPDFAPSARKVYL